MSDTYFEILRSGTNSSIQDKGRTHLYHIGITISGAMDQRIFSLSNALVNNNLNEGVIEFAYQGPLLQLKNGSANFVITGNVVFNILRKNSIIEEGKRFQSYLLEKEDQIDIIYTKDSVFGYLAIEGGFKIEKVWDSYSVNTKAKIGPNNGEKFSAGEKIYIKKSEVNNFVKKNNFGLINAGVSSFSPSLMQLQYEILEKDFNIKPNIVVAYIDQTDIGDELCRYKDKRVYDKNNTLVAVKGENYSRGTFEYTKLFYVSEITLLYDSTLIRTFKLTNLFF